MTQIQHEVLKKQWVVPDDPPPLLTAPARFVPSNRRDSVDLSLSGYPFVTPTGNDAGLRASVLQDQLLRALTLVKPLVSAKSTLPVLANAEVKAVDMWLEVTTTNLDAAITARILAKVDKPGTITVPASTMREYTAHLSPERVDLLLDKPTQQLHVMCGTARARINGIAASEFPPVPTAEYIAANSGASAEHVAFPFTALSKALKPLFALKPEWVYLVSDTSGITFTAHNDSTMKTHRLNLEDTIPTFTARVDPASFLKTGVEAFAALETDGATDVFFAVNASVLLLETSALRFSVQLDSSDAARKQLDRVNNVSAIMDSPYMVEQVASIPNPPALVPYLKADAVIDLSNGSLTLPGVGTLPDAIMIPREQGDYHPLSSPNGGKITLTKAQASTLAKLCKASVYKWTETLGSHKIKHVDSVPLTVEIVYGGTYGKATKRTQYGLRIDGAIYWTDTPKDQPLPAPAFPEISYDALKRFALSAADFRYHVTESALTFTTAPALAKGIYITVEMGAQRYQWVKVTTPKGSGYIGAYEGYAQTPSNLLNYLLQARRAEVERKRLIADREANPVIMTLSAAYKEQAWKLPLFYKGERITDIVQTVAWINRKRTTVYNVHTAERVWHEVKGSTKTGRT